MPILGHKMRPGVGARVEILNCWVQGDAGPGSIVDVSPWGVWVKLDKPYELDGLHEVIAAAWGDIAAKCDGPGGGAFATPLVPGLRVEAMVNGSGPVYGTVVEACQHGAFVRVDEGHRTGPEAIDMGQSDDGVIGVIHDHLAALIERPAARLAEGGAR
jgi:hypothetical protein